MEEAKAEPVAEGGAGEVKDDPNKIANKDLRNVFHPGRDNFPSKPYYEDGNPEMYTKENMEKREDLANDPQLKSVINEFIGKQFKRNGQGNITKNDYFTVFRNIAMILRPGIDADELDRVIKEDFENDS